MVIVGSRTENDMFGIRGGCLYTCELPLGIFHLLPGDGGGTGGDVGHTRDDGGGTDEGFLTHGDFVQIDEGIVGPKVGGSLEDEDYLLTGVGAEVDRIVMGPVGHISKARDKCGLVGDTAVGGDIHGEVTACGVLVPEGQLHGR